MANFDRKKFLIAWNDTATYPTYESIGKLFRRSEKWVLEQAKSFKSSKEQLIPREFSDSNDPLNKMLLKENLTLKQQLKTVRDQFKLVHHDSGNTDKLVELIHGINGYKPQLNPDWLTKKVESTNPGCIAVLFLSDIHMGEVIIPSQVENLNEFNTEICIQRLRNVFKRFLDIITNQITGLKIQSVVVMLGGDMLSGLIHEELAETNDCPIFQSVIDASTVLSEGIAEIAKRFKKVYVPCVVGNHGRIHKKPRAKFRVQDNYEWLIYQQIAKNLKSFQDVVIEIPESPDCKFTLFDMNFVLTHGDQFKGGNGIAGIFSPIMRGFSKKQKRHAALGTHISMLCCGHFHSYMHGSGILMNGSVPGFSEYSSIGNFDYEVPQQAMFILHPSLGVTFRMPITCA